MEEEQEKMNEGLSSSRGRQVMIITYFANSHLYATLFSQTFSKLVYVWIASFEECYILYLLSLHSFLDALTKDEHLSMVSLINDESGRN